MEPRTRSNATAASEQFPGGEVENRRTEKCIRLDGEAQVWWVYFGEYAIQRLGESILTCL